jgi:hypothetical protein
VAEGFVAKMAVHSMWDFAIRLKFKFFVRIEIFLAFEFWCGRLAELADL